MYGNKYSLASQLLLEGRASNAIGLYCEYYVINQLRQRARLSVKTDFVGEEQRNKGIAVKSRSYTRTDVEYEAAQQLSAALKAIDSLGKGVGDIADVVQMGNPANRGSYNLVAQEDIRVQFKDGSFAIFTNKAKSSDAGQGNMTSKSVGLDEKVIGPALSNGLRTELRTQLKTTLDLDEKVYDQIIKEGRAFHGFTEETTESEVLAALFPDKSKIVATNTFPSSNDSNIYPTLVALSSSITTWMGVTGAEALKDAMADLSIESVIDILMGGALSTFYPSVAVAVQAASSGADKKKALKDGLLAIDNYFLLDKSGTGEKVSKKAHKTLIESYIAIAEGTADISVGVNGTNNVYICNGNSLLVTITVRKGSSRKMGLDKCDVKAAAPDTEKPKNYAPITLGGGKASTDDLADKAEKKVDLAANSEASKEEAKIINSTLAAALQRIQDLESGKSERPSLTSDGAIKLANFYRGTGKNINIKRQGHVKALYEEILGIGLKAEVARGITAKLVNAGYMDYLSRKVGNVKLSRTKHGYKPGTNPPEPRTLNDFIDKVFEFFTPELKKLNEAKNDSESIINERWARLAGLL